MAVSSPVTKRNPRPRKYASAAARQAAYRTRNEMLEFRAEPHTAETLTRIADTIDVSRSDLLLSMVKFALANHDWARFGLTHKTIPYYQENPIMPTIYTVKAKYLIEDAEKIEKSAKENLKAWSILGQTDKYSEAMDTAYKLRAAAAEKNLSIRKEILRNAGFTVKSPKQVTQASKDESRKENPTMKKPTAKQLEARARFAEMARSGAFKKRKTNPRKKTVSQKISQLRHEGYPQKQAVAVALSEERAGKVKRNPSSSIKVGDRVRSYDFPGFRDDHYLEGIVEQVTPYDSIIVAVDKRVVDGVEMKIPASLAKVEAPLGVGISGVKGVHKISKRKTNPQKRKVSAVVLMNPKVRTREVAKGVPESKVQYAVHLADRPSYHAIAYFTKKADAVASAQEASDRTGKQLAVSRIQVHFGQM